jgi:hypothetical protein
MAASQSPEGDGASKNEDEEILDVIVDEDEWGATPIIAN